MRKKYFMLLIHLFILFSVKADESDISDLYNSVINSFDIIHPVTNPVIIKNDKYHGFGYKIDPFKGKVFLTSILFTH